MIDLKSFLLGIGCMIFVPVVQDIVSLIVSYFTNKQTLHASKVQSQINNLNLEEVNTNVVGFQVPTEQGYIGDEDE